jgi:hypothetical protein
LSSSEIPDAECDQHRTETDVQTRSGLNRIHGDAFTFVQNGALNGTPALGLSPYKPDESRVRADVENATSVRLCISVRSIADDQRDEIAIHDTPALHNLHNKCSKHCRKEFVRNGGE